GFIIALIFESRERLETWRNALPAPVQDRDSGSRGGADPPTYLRCYPHRCYTLSTLLYYFEVQKYRERIRSSTTRDQTRKMTACYQRCCQTTKSKTSYKHPGRMRLRILSCMHLDAQKLPLSRAD
ncbi:unnamed protein product, partial [Ectocarpus sp. 6 AP-2014]